jgi:hypothetical protein
MPNSNFRKFWFPTFLLAAAMAITMAGCGDSDTAGSATSRLALPTVISVTPLDGSTLVCNSSAAITATFSKAMDPFIGSIGCVDSWSGALVQPPTSCFDGGVLSPERARNLASCNSSEWFESRAD